MTSPDHLSWDYFWSKEGTTRFTQVSWSKRRIIKVLKNFIRPGQKALDAGCGSGFFSKCFCDQGMTTVAVDHSERALEIALKMTDGRCRTLKQDLLDQNAPRKIGKDFHLIFTDGLLEHFSDEDQDKIFKNFVSMLSPDGVIVTFVPNRWSPWELIRPFFMPGIDETPFILKELLDLNQRNGLKVIQKGGVNTFPFAFSPDEVFGSSFGMLLYTVAGKK